MFSKTENGELKVTFFEIYVDFMAFCACSLFHPDPSTDRYTQDTSETAMFLLTGISELVAPRAAAPENNFS